MNGQDLEVRLAGWLEADAPTSEPAGMLDELLAVTAATRQDVPRAIRLRGPVVRPWAVRPTTLRPILVALLLVTLLAAALLGAGMLRPSMAMRDGAVLVVIDGDIWAIEPDGSDLRPFIAGPDDEWAPTWSPDGRRLAWLAGNADGGAIHVTDADGRNERTIPPPAGTSVGADASIAAWSPDGGQLAVNVMDGTSAVPVIVDVEGGGARAIDGGPAYAFGWSADGAYIGLKSITNLIADTTVVRPDGSAARTLRPGSRILDSSAFDDAGSAIIFSEPSTPTTFDGDVVRMDVEDGSVETLVGGAANDVAPRLSPDGRLLAFHRSDKVTITAAFEDSTGQGATSDLYVTPLEGGPPRLLAEDVWPSATWSPSGTALATVTPDARRLLLLRVDGDAPPIEVDLPGPAGAVTWQPLGP